MKICTTFHRNKPDTINGDSITVIHKYSSFDSEEINSMEICLKGIVKMALIQEDERRDKKRMSPYPTSKEIMNDQYNSGYAAGYDKGYMNGRVQGINAGKSCIIKRIYELIDKYPNMTDCMYEVIRLLHEETEKIDD